MSDLKLGELITGEAHRDAIHVAVAPVVAGDRLRPGAHVGITGDVAGPSEHNVGIVDPFLDEVVEKGERFYLWLYPNTVTGMRHEWRHPAFDEGSEKERSDSEAWLRELADSVGISYGRLLDGAESHVDSKVNGDRWGDRWGDYIVGGAEMEGRSVPDEFWDHYERVTGRKVESEYRSNFFSCSC